MNHSTDQPPPPPLTTADNDLAPPLQPQRLSTSSCDLHPDEIFNGFCPSCLCERLSVLDHTGAPPPLPPSSKISTASLKALFKPSTSSTTRPGFFPELRRSKSFSAKNNEGFCNGFEPQRRSCDVTSSVRNVSVKTEDEARKSSVSVVVLEEETECEITEERSNEIVEEEEEEEQDELKPMKDYIDLYPQTQTKKPTMKSFFSAASVFSKKLQKWKQKQRSKKQSKNPEKKCDTQSEIADYRRSTDTDPRFSLDAGRFSVDTGRFSVDIGGEEKPRASWDGHLLAGSRQHASKCPVPLPPSMSSVVENTTAQVKLYASIPPISNIIPGGSNQTRDYYNSEPPSSRRRKSFERSTSIKKIVASEIEEVKTTSYRRVSPVETEHVNVGDKKSRRWKWSVFGFMYKRGKEEEDGYSRSNSTGVVERSLPESWPEMSKMRRSNSNVSWRSSSGGRKKEGENGMLRFYLTPMRSSWRKDGGGDGGGGRWEKTAAKANSHGHSIAKRVMRLY